MAELNVNELRAPTVLMHSYADFDSSFNFFYDETNNFRKSYVREDDLNHHFNSNFVLGGILYLDEIADLQVLFDKLNLQKNIKDAKLKHIATGSFSNCLKSKKLNTYLEFLNENKIYVHIKSVNLLFYSIVDIVDSAIMNSEAASKLGFVFAMQLKNDLYRIAKVEFQSIVELFYRFEYPNIKKESISDFIYDLTALFDDYINKEEFHFGLSSLKQILKESEKNGFLPFITDEEDYVLLKDFSDFYLNPLYLFKNSQHYFDNEDLIREILDGYTLKDNGENLDNYEFIDSEESMSIQVSDIFVGLFGKYSSYVNSSDSEAIEQEISSLEEFQIKNLKLFLSLIKNSSDFNPAFIHCIDSPIEFSKYQLIDDIVF